MTGTEVLLLLGGDRGDVPATLSAAERMIGERCGKVLARSRDHWSEAWGFDDPELFLNRALLVATSLSSQALLREVLSIEMALGRVRGPEAGYGPRTVDIDILLMGDEVVRTPDLHIPHPLMPQRAFALAPAADVAPLMKHPEMGRTVLDILDAQRAEQVA